jgi:hypothetical protein
MNCQSRPVWLPTPVAVSGAWQMHEQTPMTLPVTKKLVPLHVQHYSQRHAKMQELSIEQFLSVNAQKSMALERRALRVSTSSVSSSFSFFSLRVVVAWYDRHPTLSNQPLRPAHGVIHVYDVVLPDSISLCSQDETNWFQSWH